MSEMGQELTSTTIGSQSLGEADASHRPQGDGLLFRIRSLAWIDELHGIDPLG